MIAGVAAAKWMNRLLQMTFSAIRHLLGGKEVCLKAATPLCRQNQRCLRVEETDSPDKFLVSGQVLNST